MQPTVKIRKTLEKFGLSDNEIKVYLEAIKLEETSPYELSKKTKIPRTTVYDVVMNLSLKGLVELKQSDGFTKQQTKIVAKDPSELRAIIKQKREDLASLEVDVVDLLPKLREEFLDDKTNSAVQFLPGIEGAKEAYFSEKYRDVNIDRYIITHLMPMDTFGMKDINEDVDIEKDARVNGFHKVHELIPLTDWTKHVVSYQYGRDKDYLNNRFLRYFETSEFTVFSRITIIGDKTLITVAHEDEVYGLIIHSAALTLTFKGIFKSMWQNAIPLSTDEVSSWGTNEFLNEELGRE